MFGPRLRGLVFLLGQADLIRGDLPGAVKLLHDTSGVGTTV
jgi:hypothetical protein